MVAARGLDDEIACFPMTENRHHNHILDVSIAPGSVEPALARQAEDIARQILAGLDVVGVMAVEFFVTTDGRLLVNELAPRPHNSGHWTIDGAITSQFEQQVRAVCGLPLGAPDILAPSVMVNLLGDLWSSGTPDWPRLLQTPGLKLHLYGKKDAKPGRKMGHFTVVNRDADRALQLALEAKSTLFKLAGETVH